jgi:hypothetical protein
MAGFLASTLLITWGLFVLFFLAIGGFSFDGMMHQLDNLASRYVAADAARITSFRHVLIVAHMLLAAAVIFFRRHSILPSRDPKGATPMSDQPQLDLQAPPTAPKAAAPARSGRGFGGFTRAQLVMGAILIVALIWAMWVTKALVEPREEHIVKASLSNIVGEYVSAQARSASPPGQVEAEMRAFMSSLDHELQRRGAGGRWCWSARRC